MRFQVHMLVFGSLGVLFGVAEIVAPVEVLQAYGMSHDAGAAALCRMAAATNLGFGLTAVLSRATTDAVAQRGMLMAGVLYAVAATAATAHSALLGTSNALIWTNLLIFVPLAGNATRLLLAGRKTA